MKSIASGPSQTYSEIDNTFALLEKGEKEIKLLEDHKNVTLVVGNTGSGKSTLIQWLTENNPNLKSIEVEKGTREFIIVGGNRIGSTVMSTTLFPELIVDAKNNASIYDCPGFSDTRSSSYDIAATYFIKKLTDHVDFVKLVLTVNYPSVRQGLDRTDFVTLLRHTLHLIKSVDKYRKSIAIIVTKVDNVFLDDGKTFLSDEAVISSIANYFRSTQKTLEEKSKHSDVSQDEKLFCHNAVALLDILLTGGETGYTRIQIFRRPNQAGLLENIPLLATRRKNVEKIIHQELEFAEKGPDGFGYAISDSSKNDVHNLVEGINDKIAADAYSITVRVKNYYQKIINHNDAVLRSPSLNIIDAHEAERALIQELQKDHRIVVEFFKESKNITSLKDLTNKTKTCIITQLGITDCTDEVENVGLQAKYLDFLELVSDRTFTTRPRDWWNEFEKMATYLENYLTAVQTFENFLTQIFEKLSEYNIQKDRNKYNVADLNDWGSENNPQGIQINKNNYNQFLGNLEKMNLIGFDAQIKKIQLTEFQIRKLNHVLYLTLKKPWHLLCPESGKLIIQGDFVKFSDFIDISGNFIHSRNASSLDIFALNTVFIDRDLKENGIQLSIVAPKWETISQRVISVDGTTGPSHSLAKTASVGMAGNDGKAGLPGEPAGNILVIAQKLIASEDLTLSANGGQGGQGQQGGDGGRGIDGRDAEPNDSFRKDLLHSYGLAAGVVAMGFYEYRFYGTAGGKGGNGGDGGIGGFGGKAGEIKVIQMVSNPKQPIIRNNDGPEGKPGLGGRGGSGGSNGANYFAEFTNDHWGNGQKFRQGYPESRNGVGFVGLSGTTGQSRSNSHDPVQGEKFQCISDTVRRYKIYLRDNFQEYFNKTTFMEFVRNLDNNTYIKNSYDTVILANEMLDLEKQYNSKHPQDFLPFYKSLLRRTSEFAKTNDSQTTNSHKLVLKQLYTATLGKIQILEKKSPASHLIIDLYKYLDSIQQNINDLNNVNEKSTKLKVINQYREAYAKNIDEKIKDAEYLIETQVKPSIDIVGYQIEEETEKLLDETAAMAEAAQARKTELIAQKRKFENSLAFSWVLSGVKMISQVLGCMGPIGAVTSTVLNKATTVAESFVSTSSAPIQLPDDLVSKIRSMRENLISLQQQPFSDFKDQLSTLFNDSKKYPDELGDTSEMIQDTIASCEEAQKTRDNNQLTKLKSAFLSNLKKKALTLATNSKKIITGAVVVVKRFQKLIPFGKFGLEIYNKIKDDQNQLRVFDQQIEEAERAIQDIQQYQSKIYEEMIPVFESIGEDLNSMSNQLQEKSQVVLDVTQWKVQSFLRDVKLNMQQFTKGYSIEHNLQRCIEKLEETITTIITVYDRIQAYEGQQQLAVYIADISSPTATNIDVTNRPLNSAMIELEKIIRSNMVFEQHKAAVNALAQHVFPFAYYYLDNFSLVRSDVPQQPGFENLVNQAAEEVKGLQMKMTEYKTSITKSDSFISTTWFSTDYKISNPFFVWENEEYHDEISNLLSGEKVILKANILNSIPGKDAIKFKRIGLKFSSKNTTLTKEINEQLKRFSVRATHMGNSYYRFNHKIYVITSDHQQIKFSFEKDANDKPVDRNSNYDKIESGDAMLSPYALWEIQLVSSDGNLHFSEFDQYKNIVNLELEGHGCYVTREANVSDADVEKYYTVTDVVGDDVRPRKRDLRVSVMHVQKDSDEILSSTEKPGNSSASAITRLMPWFSVALQGILIYAF